MATAAELLAKIGETDDTLVIDNYLRTINIPSSIKNLGVEFDDDVLRLNFKMPRYLDDTDLSAFTIRVNYMNANGDGDVYTVRDKVVGSDYITFSWLVGPTATKYKGNTKFNVCLKIVNGATVEREYNTTIASLPVLEGLEIDEQVVTRYTDILEQWRRELFGIGDTEEASMRQVSQDEQENIVQKGAEVLATIPKEYQETAEAAQEGIRTKADAIMCSAQGDPIVVSDSSDDHVRGLKVFGKTTQAETTGAQVIPHPYYDSSMLRHGVTFTVNNDGSITMTGTNTAPDNVSCYFMLYLGSIPTGVYTYKCYGLPQTCVTNIYFRGDVVGEESAQLDLYDGNEYGFVIRIKSGATVNATVYPMLNVGDTALPYEPYSGGVPSPNPDYPRDLVSIENPTVRIYGKNLANVDVMLREGFMTKDGDVYTLTKGSYRFSNTQSCYIPANTPICFFAEKIEYTGTADFWLGFNVTFEDGSSGTVGLYTSGKAYSARTYSKAISKIGLFMATGDEAGAVVKFKKLQVEMGSAPTQYEPYVSQQSATLNHVIRGIPVNSGGNYTDSDGQQWICDEIDLERGVYVQRIFEYTLTGSETYGVLAETVGEMLMAIPHRAPHLNEAVLCKCNYYQTVSRQQTFQNGDTAGFVGMSIGYGHLRVTDNVRFNGDYQAFQAWVTENYNSGTPVIVTYILETPVEAPLTAEEISAYKALYSNYPITTVFNNAGAWMELAYNADTKTYVKSPFVVNVWTEVIPDPDDPENIEKATVIYHSDKTYDEILAAKKNDQVVMCRISNRTLYLDTVTELSPKITNPAVAFGVLFKYTHHRVTIYMDGTVVYDNSFTFASTGDLQSLSNEMNSLKNSSKVYIGTSEPTDSNVDVWIDTDDVETGTGGSGNNAGTGTTPSVPESTNGIKPWENCANVTVEEAVWGLTIDLSKDGEVPMLSEIKLYAIFPASDSGSSVTVEFKDSDGKQLFKATYTSIIPASKVTRFYGHLDCDGTFMSGYVNNDYDYIPVKVKKYNAFDAGSVQSIIINTTENKTAVGTTVDVWGR